MAHILSFVLDAKFAKTDFFIRSYWVDFFVLLLRVPNKGLNITLFHIVSHSSTILYQGSSIRRPIGIRKT